MPTGRPVLQRRISARAFAGLYVLLVLIAIAVWLGGFMLLHDVRPAVIIVAGLAPLVIGVLATWLARVSTEYRVFDDSLEVESGLLARRIDNLQLFRVRDLGLRQSLFGRILGVGDVSITSTDRSSPHLRLRGVADPREVYQTLRDLVARSQATRRTVIMEEDPDQHGG